MFLFFNIFIKSFFALKTVRILIIFSILFNSPLFPHGIDTKIINGGIGLNVIYDDLSPISFAETKVFSPDKKDIPFQEGFTDKNGSFVFVPDKIGIWKIVINDGMGHGVIKKIEIKNLKDFKQNEHVSFSRWYKILIGLSFILGITGIISYYQARKTTKGEQKDAHS